MFGEEMGCWCSSVLREDFDIGMCKVIGRIFKSKTISIVRDERRVEFWLDMWYEELPLRDFFPTLFAIVSSKDLENAWEQVGEREHWSLCLSRHF